MRKVKSSKNRERWQSEERQAANMEGADLIGEIAQSLQFAQMKIYMRNFKFEKALAVIDQLLDEYSATGEPNTLLFMLKQKYHIQLNIGHLAAKDAELTLQNMLAVIEQHEQDFVVLAPHEVVAIHSDLLLHYLNHSTKTMGLSSAKTGKQA